MAPTIRENLGLALLVLALLALGLPAWDASWAELRPADGSAWREPWRLVLGHWVHRSWSHLLLNGVALAGWMVLWRSSPLERLSQLVWVGLMTGAGVCWVSDAEFVVGLSGLLHGLYVATALTAWRGARTPGTSLVVLAIIAAKLVTENVLGPSAALERTVGLPIATEAHWIGTAAGVAYGGAWFLRRRIGRRREPAP